MATLKRLMSFKPTIRSNAKAIAELHRQTQEGSVAWREFRDSYEAFAFPGGTANIRERLRAGDPEAIQYALDFIEVRPYFFRSGYMFKDFVRVLNNCPLSDEQRSRYERVRTSYQDYRARRRSSNESFGR